MICGKTGVSPSQIAHQPDGGDPLLVPESGIDEVK